MAWWGLPVTDGQAIYRKEFVNQFIELHYRLFGASPTVGGVSGDDTGYAPHLMEAGDSAVSIYNVFFELRNSAVARLFYAARKSAVTVGGSFENVSLSQDVTEWTEATRPYYYDVGSGKHRLSGWFLDALNANHPRSGGTSLPFAPSSFLAPSEDFSLYSVQTFPWTRKFTQPQADPEDPQPDEWPNILTEVSASHTPVVSGDLYGAWLFEEFYALLITMQQELVWDSTVDVINAAGFVSSETRETYCLKGNGYGTSLGHLPCDPVTWYSLVGVDPVPIAVAEAESQACIYPLAHGDHTDDWRPADNWEAMVWGTLDPGSMDPATNSPILAPDPCAGAVTRTYAQNAEAYARRVRWLVELTAGVPSFPVLAAARALRPVSPFGPLTFERWDDYGSASDDEFVAVESIDTSAYPTAPVVFGDFSGDFLSASGLVAEAVSTEAYAAVGYIISVHLFYGLPEDLEPDQPNPFLP